MGGCRLIRLVGWFWADVVSWVAPTAELNHGWLLQLYHNVFSSQQAMVSELDQRVKSNKTFEEAYREFESQKVCYLPLNTFFLKPGQRMLHYKLILERTC